MLMWAAMQLQWSIPLHSSTGAQAAWQPALAYRRSPLLEGGWRVTTSCWKKNWGGIIT